MTRQELDRIIEEHGKWLRRDGGARASLNRASLDGASLDGALLDDASLDRAWLPHFQIPQNGELRVYKRVQGKIVHLKIPNGAKRTACLINRKCRADRALVLAIEGDEPVTTRGVTYQIGQMVYPDSYDPDIRVDCTHGIHFWLTRKEAEEWR